MKPSKHEIVRPKAASGRIVRLRVVLSARVATDGSRTAFLSAGPWRVRCAIGRTGVTRHKREGDGATPIGEFSIPRWWIQPVRPGFFRTGLKTRTIRRDDGWCDDIRSGAYNQWVRRPFAMSSEEMWRDDGKYAAVGVIDYNLRPRRRGVGSAIFFHLCGDDYSGTAGCIAIRARDLRKLLPRLSSRVRISIG